MALANDHTQNEQISQADFQTLLQEKMRQAVRLTLVTILEEEVEAFVGARRYQRTGERRDRRNGYYERGLVTGVGAIEALPVPRARKGFQTQVFQRYKRRQAELDEAICDMFVQGISMVRVGEVFEGLTGSQASPSTASRVFHTLGGEFEAWKNRPLAAFLSSPGSQVSTTATIGWRDEAGCASRVTRFVSKGPDQQGRNSHCRSHPSRGSMMTPPSAEAATVAGPAR
jgi:hypothetical protein